MRYCTCATVLLFAMAVSPAAWGVSPTAEELTEDWQAVAGDLLGDYYPLLPYCLDDAAWIAWQFDQPEAGRGAVQVFRRSKSPQKSIRLKLHGLDPAARYVLVNRDRAGTTELTGRELMDPGLAVTLNDQPCAAIFAYRRVP